MIPPSRSIRRQPADLFTLQAINNTSVATYGTRSLTLDLGLRRTFRWVFVVANVKHPILGADFLRHFSLLVDMRHHRLADGLTQLSVQGVTCSMGSPSPAILPRKPTSVYDKILADFPTVTRPCTSDAPTKHDVTHHISTTGPHLRTSTPLRTRTPPSSAARIRSYVRVRHHTTLLQQLVLATPHGP